MVQGFYGIVFHVGIEAVRVQDRSIIGSIIGFDSMVAVGFMDTITLMVTKKVDRKI